MSRRSAYRIKVKGKGRGKVKVKVKVKASNATDEFISITLCLHQRIGPKAIWFETFSNAAGLGSGELSGFLLFLLGDRNGGEGGGTRRGFGARNSPPVSSHVGDTHATNSPSTTASKDLLATVARTSLMRTRPKETAHARLTPETLEPKWLRRMQLDEINSIQIHIEKAIQWEKDGSWENQQHPKPLR